MWITKRARNVKAIEQLILYILANYNNENLTETKLNKLLYFCDFNFFEKNKKPITSGVYMRNNYGPTLRGITAILEGMIGTGKIKPIKEKNHFGSPQTRYTITTNKLTFNFNEEELRVIKEVNEKYRELKPSELSLISHFDAPFLAANLGAELNYNDTLFRDDEFIVTDEERTKWSNLLTEKEKGKLVRLAG